MKKIAITQVSTPPSDNTLITMMKRLQVAPLISTMLGTWQGIISWFRIVKPLQNNICWKLFFRRLCSLPPANSCCDFEPNVYQHHNGGHGGCFEVLESLNQVITGGCKLFSLIFLFKIFALSVSSHTPAFLIGV